MNQKQEATPQGDPSLYYAKTTLRNCALTWLVPGFGYWLTGRKRAFYIISACLFIAFLLGVFLGGDLYPFRGEGNIRSVGALCQMGMGFPYFLAKLFVERGSPLNPTYDYASSYLLVAGMMNWLSVIDIYDISVKRK